MLRFTTFGTSSVSTNQYPLRFTVGAEGRSCAAYLFSNPNRVHRRERILANFWPNTDEKDAKKRLNNTLSSMRQAIARNTQADPDTVILSNHNDLMIHEAEDIVVDAVNLRNCVESEWNIDDRVLPRKRLDRLRSALTAYYGHFLEDCDATWLHSERSEYFHQFIRGRIILLRHYYAENELESAIQQAETILAWDDTREMILRDLIRLYVLNGQSAKAVQCYRKFTDTLQKEHSLEPMPVTRELISNVHNNQPITSLETYTRKLGTT